MVSMMECKLLQFKLCSNLKNTEQEENFTSILVFPSEHLQ